jgi:arsenate reductase
MSVKIYHNPRCSKSRQTLALIEEQGITPEIIEYLSDVPSESDLDFICTQLAIEPLTIIRTKEKLFAELGLSKKDEKSRQEWIQLMVMNPKLIERPIVVNGDKVAIGRPPENVLGIL